MIDKLKTAILFMCHTLFQGTLQEYEKINEAVKNMGDTFLLFHNKESNIPSRTLKYSPFCYSETNISQLNYPNNSNQFINGNTHLPTLLFYRDHPEYDYYWRIEYDVRFSGDWRSFFESVALWDEDFVSCHIRSYHDQPHWPGWNLSHPDQEIELSQRYASFNPIFRISRAALKAIDEFQRNGWQGHQEVLLPSLLYHANFRLRDFGGKGEFVSPGDENRFYISSHEGSSVRWRPFFLEIPENDGKLYHPVRLES